MAKGSKKKGGGKSGRKSAAEPRRTTRKESSEKSSETRKKGPRSGPEKGVAAATAVYVPIVAFLTGASVMIVELAASRVLSPHFGNTLYTWTALIGVIMIALAGGYYLGGRLADRMPKLIILLHLVSAAAITVLAIPFLALEVSGKLAPEGQAVDIVWGPVVAALLLFAIPGCLLGTVTPFAVKLLSLRSENEKVGTSAGTISGLSTVGSVLGTFGSGFILIPSMSIRTIFIVVGITLAVVAAIGYAGVLGFRSRSYPAAGMVLVGAMMLAFVANASVEPEAPGSVFETDTYYHRIQVRRWREHGRKVIEVSMDRAPEGAQYEDSGDLRYDYTKFYRLERLFCPEMEQAAFLGGGAYSMPEALVDDHPDVTVEVAEIDPMVAKVGREFFRLDEYENRVIPITADARRFLASSTKRYDLIFGDAYRGRQNVPSHMVTREFFDLVRRRLDEDGVFMMNLIGAVDGTNSRFFTAVASTLLDVFPELYVFAILPSYPELTQNLILVAPVQELGYTRDQLLELAGEDAALVRMVRNLVPRRAYDLSQATVLTDDYNPVQYIIAKQLREAG